MQILLLAKKPPYPTHDGEAIGVMQLAQGLADQGFKVHILYLNTGKHSYPPEKIPDTGIQYHAVDHKAEVTLTGLFRSIFTRLPYHVTRFFSLKMVEKAEELARAIQFDIIQAESLYTIQCLLAIRGYKGLRIYRSQNREFKIWKSLSEHSGNPLKRWYLGVQAKKLRTFENKISGQMDAILPVSTVEAEEYRNAQPSVPQHYAPTPVDIPQEEFPTGDGLYFIGGLDWLPNQEGLRWFLKEVWPLVHAKFPHEKFHIAGRNAPHGFAATLPAGIVFHGAVPDAMAFSSDKRICIAPLLSGGGMKIKILEAMACGKPVVSTSKGAEGMPPGIADRIKIADSPMEFLRELTSYIEHASAARNDGKAARSFITENYSRKAVSAGVSAFYKTLLTR